MDMQTVQKWCLDLPGTVEDLKWGEDICFCVGKKMYAVMGVPKEGKEVGLSFKTTPDLAEQLVQQPDVEPAPYLARYHWVMLRHLNALEPDTLHNLIKESYKLVFEKLPKKLQREIAS